MSLLTIVQSVANRTKLLSTPDSVIGSGNDDVQQVKALLDKLGNSLARQYDWSFLRKQQSISTVASQEEYAISTVFSDGDFRKLVSDTEWDNTNSRALIKANAAEWQFINNAVGATTGVTRVIYRRGGNLLINPIPSSVDTLIVEYVSKYWRTNSGGTAISAFSDDTDLTLFPEELLEDGLEYMVRKAYGVPYLDEYEHFKEALSIEKAMDAPRNRIEPPMRVDGPFANIPETGFGS